jgi:hypothetical protein
MFVSQQSTSLDTASAAARYWSGRECRSRPAPRREYCRTIAI